MQDGQPIAKVFFDVKEGTGYIFINLNDYAVVKYRLNVRKSQLAESILTPKRIYSRVSTEYSYRQGKYRIRYAYYETAFENVT